MPVDADREALARESASGAQGQKMRFDKGSNLFDVIGLAAFRFDSGQLFSLMRNLSVQSKTFPIRFDRKPVGPKWGRPHSRLSRFDRGVGAFRFDISKEAKRFDVVGLIGRGRNLRECRS